MLKSVPKINVANFSDGDTLMTASRHNFSHALSSGLSSEPLSAQGASKVLPPGAHDVQDGFSGKGSLSDERSANSALCLTKGLPQTRLPATCSNWSAAV